jgi:hypothetical protein
MKKLALALGLTLTAVVPSLASYRMFSQSTVVGLFQETQHIDINETDGRTTFTGHAAMVVGPESGSIDVDARFGVLRGYARSIGQNYSVNGTLLFWTDDTLRFMNPTGGSIQVQFDLSVVGGVLVGPTTYSGSATFSVALGEPGNYYAGTTYRRTYFNNVLTSMLNPSTFVVTVPNGGIVPIRHTVQLITQSLSANAPVIDDFTKGSMVNIRVLTPGAKFVADSGARYFSVVPPAPFVSD